VSVWEKTKRGAQKLKYQAIISLKKANIKRTKEQYGIAIYDAFDGGDPGCVHISVDEVKWVLLPSADFCTATNAFQNVCVLNHAHTSAVCRLEAQGLCSRREHPEA
jgi:hypothetical protein